MNIKKWNLGRFLSLDTYIFFPHFLPKFPFFIVLKYQYLCIYDTHAPFHTLHTKIKFWSDISHNSKTLVIVASSPLPLHGRFSSKFHSIFTLHSIMDILSVLGAYLAWGSQNKIYALNGDKTFGFFLLDQLNYQLQQFISFSLGVRSKWSIWLF